MSKRYPIKPFISDPIEFYSQQIDKLIKLHETIVSSDFILSLSIIVNEYYTKRVIDGYCFSLDQNCTETLKFYNYVLLNLLKMFNSSDINIILEKKRVADVFKS